MWQTAWQTAGGRNVSSSSASSCTHDFLSRCADGSQPSHHSDHTSPTPPAAAAPATGHPAATGPSSLTTHDFLQPLERGSGGGTYRADRDGRVPSGFGRGGTAFTAIAQALADRLVPGSSGTQAETVSPNSQHHRPLPNSSSRDDQSVVEHPLRVPDAAMDPDSTNFPSTHADSLAYWSSMRLKFAASDAAFSKGNGVSQPGPGPGPVPPFAKEWHAEPCLRPVKLLSEDDEDEEEECRDSSHKEAVFHKAESMQKQDAKNDLKGGTPRSKHSATEQRRRSKINDRFQMLRLLVPHSDQKRDKASFLLEVIEYIQILKDKVKKYESVEQGRKQDRLKSMVWDLCKRNVGSGDPALGGGIDPSRLDALVLGKDYGAPMSVVSLESMQQSAQSPFPRSVPLGGYPATAKAQPANEAPLLNNISASISNSYDRDRFSEASESLHHSTRARLNGHQGGGGGGGGGVSRDHFLHQQQQHQMEQRHCGQGMRPDSVHTQVGTEEGTAKAVGSKVDQRQCASTPTNGQHSPQANTVENEAAIARNSAQSNNGSCHDQSQQEDSRAPPHAGHDPVAIQGGVINVSSVYSQGLLDTLTKALHSSGLDLSQAKISVQIDLGKTTVSASTKVVTVQTPESSTQSHQSQEHTRQAASYPDSDLVHPHKRPKIETEG